jgi:hypothetical protein
MNLALFTNVHHYYNQYDISTIIIENEMVRN